MLEEINMLREKLEQQVLGNAPYKEVLCTSKQIDSLLVKYYETVVLYK